jgi:hypothetical protein
VLSHFQRQALEMGKNDVEDDMSYEWRREENSRVPVVK